MTPREVLVKYWGYPEFRPSQEEIIASVLSGHDTLGLLPTGGGKSITFQVPALLLPGLTLVVTPLISLMKDQVDNLRQRGIDACHLFSGMTRREQRLAMDRCAAGRCRLLYVSPERLRDNTFVESLRPFGVSLIVVDEAHCISQWGYDFRPSYLKIGEVRGMFPDAPVLALTASATPRVADDIMERLGFRGRAMFTRSFSRKNLSYIVRTDPQKDRRLIKVLRNTSGSAIVYVRSRKRTREIADLLAAEGLTADFYHAGLDPRDKAERQDRWKRGDVRVMVATNAFGMGIDKPDVRTVVHYDLPSSLEEYYQEAGRAGRDGLPAFAVLLAAPSDKALLTRRISESFPPKEFICRVYELACNFAGVALGEGFDRTYDFDFYRFVMLHHLRPGPTRTALLILSRAGYFEYNDDVYGNARVMLLATREALYEADLSPDLDNVLQTLLRSYTGLFADYVQISEELVVTRTGLDQQRVYDALLALNRMHILHYIPRRTLPYLYFPHRRELPKHILLPLEVYAHQKAALERRITAMKQFAFDSSECRVNILLRYFGETPSRPCSSCDVCRANAPRTPIREVYSTEQTVRYLVGQPGGHTVESIVGQLTPGARAEGVETIRRLLDSGECVLSQDGRVTLR